MQQNVLPLIVNNIGQNKGEEIYSHTLLNSLVVPIKLVENPSPLVHLHFKQDRKTNKGLLQALISDMKL